MKNKLLIICSKFPFSGGEPYLEDEVKVLSKLFATIDIYPAQKSLEGPLIKLPENVRIINDLDIETKISIAAKFTLFFEVIKDAVNSGKWKYFFETFKYNLSLLKQNYYIAKSLSRRIDSSFVVYSYWGNELATIASFCKQINPSCNAVSRVHGFDVFEDQTVYNYVPFRIFQLKHLDKIVSVSKKGADYLKKSNLHFKHKIDYSYLGSFDFGLNPITESSVLTIATCSIIRAVKRLDLIVKILMYARTSIKWYVIGNGEQLDELKIKCKQLPENVQVVFVGYLNKEQLIEFYKSTPINLFCSVSSSEGLPFSMIEAISFGIPLLSTNVGGCSEICNSQTGILIDRNASSTSIAKYIDDFMGSEMNTAQFRNEVKLFWNTNFNANINYEKFSKLLIGKDY